MTTEPNAMAGTNQARRSIMASLLTIALLAVAVTFVVDGALRAITILAAVAAVVAAFRGLPDALIDIAARTRGATYFKTLSYVVPIGALLLSIYLVWVFWGIRSSGLLSGIPLEFVLVVLVAAGLLNLTVIAVNALSAD